MGDLLGLILLILLLPQLLRLTENVMNVMALKMKKEQEAARLKNGTVTPEDLHRLTPREFEEWCADYLAARGYTDIRTAPPGADGGRDILCRKNGEKVYIECKRFAPGIHSSYKVEIDIVRKLLGAMVHDGIHYGIIMTTGSIRPDAREFAASLPEAWQIRIWDGEALTESLPAANAERVTAPLIPGTLPQK